MNVYNKKNFLKIKIIFAISGILQGIIVTLLIPLLPLLLNVEWNQASKWLVVMGLIAIICFVCQFIGTSMGNDMAVWEVCDKQIHNIGKALTKLPLGWFSAKSKGEISQIISTDINTLSHLPSVVLPEIYIVVFSSFVIAVTVTYIYWPLGIIMAIMGLILWGCWNFNIQTLEEVEKHKTVANQTMAAKIVEFSQLQIVLRATGVLINGWSKLNQALIDDKDATLAVMKKQSLAAGIYMTTANVGMFLVLILAAFATKSGVIDLASFLTIAILIVRFANPLAGLLPYGTEINAAKIATNNILQVTEAKTLLVSDKPKRFLNNRNEGCSIEFKDVNFSYIDDYQVLYNFNFTAPAKSITALVGPSGSGKSTITRLIARFWDTQYGRVLINGIDVKDIAPEALMETISMVFQEVYLFNTTIRENIAMAKPGSTNQEIERAAKEARLDEVINRLPNGWDTLVGEGGSALSGGEKQRVSIARAFLKDSPILLLDEITSALDGTNEAIITKSIQKLAENRTVIIIAHRLSSIKHADKIVLIEQGRILEEGSHDDLLKKSGAYNKLWQASLSSENWQV